MWSAAKTSLCVLLLFQTATLGAEPVASNEPERTPRLTVATTRFDGIDLMTLDVYGKDAVRETRDPKGAVGPTWSPDGKRLAFASYRTGRGQVFVIDAEGKESNLTSSTAFERNPAWSPDGKAIAFCGDRAGSQAVWLMDADGSNQQELTTMGNFNCDPTWSPDGKRLAFVSGRSGGNRLWLMNADGSEPTNLVPQNEIGALYPTWSADGKQIVYGSQAENRTVQLFVVNVDGSGRQQLTKGERSNSYAAWSPDGQYIAYIRFVRWPGSLDPTSRPDPDLPPADLVVYDTVSDQHTTISTGDISMWGPRPSWKPTASQVGAKQP